MQAPGLILLILTGKQLCFRAVLHMFCTISTGATEFLIHFSWWHHIYTTKEFAIGLGFCYISPPKTRHPFFLACKYYFSWCECYMKLVRSAKVLFLLFTLPQILGLLWLILSLGPQLYISLQNSPSDSKFVGAPDLCKALKLFCPQHQYLYSTVTQSLFTY